MKGGDNQMTQFRLFIAAGILLAGLVITTSPVLAQGKSEEPRPGFGFGDNKREHTGPPGQTIRPERPPVSIANILSFRCCSSCYSVRSGNAGSSGSNGNGGGSILTGAIHLYGEIINFINVNIFYR